MKTQLVVKGALRLVALVLHVTHRVEHLFKRTFQVAEDASTDHAVILQRDVHAQEQVAGLLQPVEALGNWRLIHVSLQNMTG